MTLATVILSLLFSASLSAATQLKIAALVPEGSSWGNNLRKFSQEVKDQTKGEVTVKVYYGGVAGDEPDVLRKIRIGQFQGGVFTGKTLGDIFGDVRAMEIPFTFYSDQKKASETLKKLAPKFNEGLKAQGFINLGYYELGPVYLVTTKKVTNLEELKGIKIWAWQGDELVKAMIESLGLVSTPLALPDVLSSLSTGIIDAAYAPPVGIIALQWHTKIKYLVDFPSAFSIGALLVSSKAWSKIKPEDQQKVLALSQKYVTDTNVTSAAENDTAKAQMKKSGVEFVSFPEADYKKASSLREEVIKKVQGKLISSGMIQNLNSEIKK